MDLSIRPIRPDDGPRLRRLHARQSPRTRRDRFLAAKPQLSAADARYLSEVDGRDHVALVATEGEEIIAVARFVRLREDPEVAEFAIVVGDDHQRQGLGSELLRRLATEATARGVRRLRGSMLADNVAIHRLVDRVAADTGAGVARHRLGTVHEVDIDLGGVAPPVRSGAPAMIAGCAGS